MVEPRSVDPLLAAAIETEKQRIEVDPYFTTAMNKGLKGHAMGYWSGTLMGLITGAVCGGIAALCGFTFGLPALAMVGATAGLGGMTGGVVGSRVGSSAGVVSGALAEKERREKAQQLEQEILKSPEKQREVIEKYKANPVVEKDNTVAENFATKPASKALESLIDLKTMPLTMLLCAGAGMLMFAGMFAVSGGAIGIAGLAVNSMAAAVGLGAAVGAGVGISFGINYPMIFTSLTKGAGDLLSGKTVRGETGHAPVATQISPEVAIAKYAAASYSQRRDDTQRPHAQVSQAQLDGALQAMALQNHI